MHSSVSQSIGVGVMMLLLAACHQSQIQGDYFEISNGCKAMAEATVAATSGATTKAARNAELVTVFSDCMAKKGWAVATPKRAKSTGTRLSTSGTPAMTKPQAEPIPDAATTTVSPTPNINTQYQYNQPVVQPVGEPDYSIYQPAYPKPSADVTPPAPTRPQNTSPALRRY